MGKDHFGKTDTHGRIILKWILQKVWRRGLDSSFLGQGLRIDPCDVVFKLKNAIKVPNFLANNMASNCLRKTLHHVVSEDKSQH